MRTQIVKIGNSQGIRIPKLILKQSSIKDEVEIKAQNGNIIIFPAKHPRHDWDEAFQTMHEQSDDKMLDDNLQIKLVGMKKNGSGKTI